MAKFVIEVEIEEGYTHCDNCPFSTNEGDCGMNGKTYINCSLLDLNKVKFLKFIEEK